MEEDMIGAIKIKDGLFIGDSFAAKDLEFVVANKVTKIINCSGRQVQNQWSNIGV
jgi:protein-tyrosine phosphatase